MITINAEKNGYVIDLPEYGIHQPFNPDTGDLFKTEAEAQAWQDEFVAGLEAAKVAHQIELDDAAAALSEKQARAAKFERLVEIDRLSSSPRACREIALGNTAWVAELDAEAHAIRATL